MKKIFLILIPPIISIIVFAGGLYLVNRTPAEGALQVTSTPGSKVFLDGNLIGETPLCKCNQNNMIKVGEHVVKLAPKKGEFQAYEQKIKISPSVLTVIDRSFDQNAFSQGSIITLTPLEDKTSVQLSVISFPDRSQVYLDASLVGSTPLLLKSVSESDHELRLSRDGYKEKTLRIRTVKGYKLESIIYLGADPSVASSAALPSSTITPSPAPVVSKIVILSTPTGFLRVRETNNVSAAQVALVYPGEKYDLVSEQGDWFEIKLPDGKTGWISNQYSSKE
jgi:hypothetical protein